MVLPYDETAPGHTETETATFGLGCFWGPDARFGAMDAVVRTRAGYAGGTTDDPSYTSLGDHTEVLQIEYHPDEWSYRDVFELVFRAHDPQQQPTKTQYQNVVFYASDDERTAIEAVLDDHGTEHPSTRIEPLDAFYIAEAYHQKYRLRNHQLAEQFTEYSDEAFRESPAAATLNGCVAGHIDSDDLSNELKTLYHDTKPA